MWKFNVKKVLLSNGTEEYIIKQKLHWWFWWNTHTYDNDEPIRFKTHEEAQVEMDELIKNNQSKITIVKEMAI